MYIYNKSQTPPGFYVYAYLRKSDNTPYYIGKGQGSRAWGKHHFRIPKDTTKIVILEANLTELGALALERRMIKWYGRKDIGTGTLNNRTDGGDGTNNPSPESRAKQGANKGKVTWNKGISTGPRSAESIAKQSSSTTGVPKSESHKANMKGHIPHNKGKKAEEFLTQEARDKIRDTHKGKPKSDTHKLNNSIALKAYRASLT